MVSTRRNDGGAANGRPLALVTGGCGFLGRHLAEQLVAGGTYSVRVFDLRAPKEGEGVPGVEYIAGDLRRSEDVVAACQGEAAAGVAKERAIPPAFPLYSFHGCT
jgi:nucleoside-diphosphate-sugar epimerase